MHVGTLSQEQEQNLFHSKDPIQKKAQVFLFRFVLFIYLFLAHSTQEELSMSLLVFGPVACPGFE